MPDEAPRPTSDSTEQKDAESQPMDWRLLAIIAIIILFFIAIYINQTFYGKKTGTEEQTATTAPPEAQAPPMSPAEQYAAVKRTREFLAAEETYRVGDNVYITACPATPIRDKENPNQIANILPGQLFDVTQRMNGLSPLMLQRRRLYGGQQSVPMFINTVPTPGLTDNLKMTFQTVTPETSTEAMQGAGLVIGVAVGDEAKAYPVWFVNFHDVINDTIGGKPILLCWSALAINASAMERTDTDKFGSSGFLYQGAIVTYDAKTRSLWCPLLRECIAGERVGEIMPPIPTVLTTWSEWVKMHPDTLLLTGTDPELHLSYATNPAFPTSDYPSNSLILYPAYGFAIADSPMNVKTEVFGVTSPDGKAVKAYSAPLLREKLDPFDDKIGDADVVIQYNAAGGFLTATDAEGKPLFVENMLWLNWFGTHPDTEIWRKDEMPYPFAEKMTPAPELPDDIVPPESVPGTELPSAGTLTPQNEK